LRSSFTTNGVGGVRIVADRLGDPAAPAVVFLHGARLTSSTSAVPGIWLPATATTSSPGQSWNFWPGMPRTGNPS